VLANISKIIALIFVFIIAAGAGAFLTVHLLIKSEEIVVVPDLVNKEVVYALERLTDLGLNTKVKGSEFSHNIPRHHVVGQDPPPGSEIKRGRDVRIILSKGVRSIKLPNLIGLSFAQARLLLEESGLHLGLLSRMAEELPRDTVVAQYPLAGTDGLRDAKLDLLVSAGPPVPWQMMTDLRNMTFEDVLRVVERNNLVPGLITERKDHALPNEIIIAHDPPAGYPVARSSSIDMTVNRHFSPLLATGRSQYRLFRYRVPGGYLRRSIRVELNQPPLYLNLFNAFVAPGEEIWLLAPQDPAMTTLYVDDEPTLIMP
jgi:serine/threonine-protein kinase